jgi:hypothetical protein
LQTTETHDLYLDEKISLRAKDSVDRVGMHGSAVVKQHYLMRSQEDAAQSSLEVGQALRSQAIGPVMDPTRPKLLTTDFARRAASSDDVITNYLLLPWGVNHSSGGDISKRATWDEAELYDLHLKQGIISERYPDRIIPAFTPVVPLLLKMIHADPNAIPIFAKCHILDSARLSTGKAQSTKKSYCFSHHSLFSLCLYRLQKNDGDARRKCQSSSS